MLLKRRSDKPKPPPVLPPAILQPRGDTIHQLAISYATMKRMEARGMLRVVKFGGPRGRSFHIVDEVKQLIEAQAARGAVTP
jgi:hypothetical protein